MPKIAFLNREHSGALEAIFSKGGRRGLFGECLWKNEVAQKFYKLKRSKTICPVICSSSGFSASESLGLTKTSFIS